MDPSPADLPDRLKVGLFARPATYTAYIRFSNSREKADDTKPDVHGMAIKLTEVTLSMLYRNTDDPDNPHGGAMWVASKGFTAWSPKLRFAIATPSETSSPLRVQTRSASTSTSEVDPSMMSSKALSPTLSLALMRSVGIDVPGLADSSS